MTCEDCDRRIESLLGTSAATEAKWTCPTCGEVSFEKGADPVRPVSGGIEDAIVTVCAIFAIAAVLITCALVKGC